MENKPNVSKRFKLSPEKMLEICNGINAAVVAKKVVTLDLIDIAHTIQIAGAFPNVTGVYCILHNDWHGPYEYKVNFMMLQGSCVVRAYYPRERTVDIIYEPHPDDFQLINNVQ